MKKFRCVVTRTDEYVVEIDESVITEEWMEDYRKTFGNIKTLKGHAELIAQEQARGEIFIEGYGVPMVDHESQYYMGEKSKHETGINIVIISEDDECEVDSIEIV